MPLTPARGRQLSLFGVEARAPAPIDLEGLLAAAGQIGRMGGTGRVSIVLSDAWRCAVLRTELEVRGLVVSCEPTGEEDRWHLRTAYSAALAPLAARWLDDDGGKVAPRRLVLDGRALRLWVAAAGEYDGQRAYLLRLAPRPLPEPPEPEKEPEEELPAAAEPLFPDEEPAPPPAPTPVPVPRPERPNVRKRKSESKITAFDPGPDEFADAEDFYVDEWADSADGDLPTVELEKAPEQRDPPEMPPAARDPIVDRRAADNWIAVGDALEAVGLPAVLVGAETGGPAYRIVGPRRITRLAELVGEPPAAAPTGAWPA
ncbi:hypothetical protein AB0M46_45210 [Dactylosporangium sp. NPDC051485]|uniref:hypothetical protein n=1 Tax=Dactylosporangium sp. NPDC051485 TaxID=3154846 RepID=UPI00341F4EE0